MELPFLVYQCLFHSSLLPITITKHSRQSMKIEGSFRLLVWEGPVYFRTMVGQNVMAGEWGRLKPHVPQAEGKEDRLGSPLDLVSQRPNHLACKDFAD